MKKLKIFTILSLLVSTSAFSSDCATEISYFGEGPENSFISESCRDDYLSRTPASAKKISNDGKIEISGYKNIVFVTRKYDDGNVSRTVIAGKYSELNSVGAVSLDTENDEVAILDSVTGDINFYSMTVTGNVAPFRILKNEIISGSTEVAVNSKDDEVVVINPNAGSIQFFSRLANVAMPEGKRNMALKRSIEGLPTSISNLSIDTANNELSVKDNAKNQVLVYNLVGDNSAGPKRIE